MKKINKELKKRLKRMTDTGFLFKSTVSGDEVYKTYLESFKEEDDPIFRDPNSSSHNCNCCKAMLRRYGNIVAIDPTTLEVITLFDSDIENEEYGNSWRALDELLSSAPITAPFYESLDYLQKESKLFPISQSVENSKSYILGTIKNVKRYTQEDINKYPNSGFKVNETVIFEHLYLDMPKKFIVSGSSSEKIEGYKETKQILTRLLNEITLDHINQVIELERSNSLLNGKSFIQSIKDFGEIIEEYNKVSEENRDNWLWLASGKYPRCLTRLRNTVQGTLLTDLAEGKPLEDACRSFNKKVDPTNYMKASAPITQKMIDEAEKKVEELGLTSALNRRCATVDDVCISDILHTNTADRNLVNTSNTLFSNLKPSKNTSNSSLINSDKLKTITFQEFLDNILPNSKDINLWLENNHEKNFMTLTTSVDKNVGNLFKWNNPYALTFVGGLAGKSQIKQAVKAAGGFVDAPFRCSIMWNCDEIPGCVNNSDVVDLDLHAVQPNGDHIYFGSFRGNKTSISGMLDIDMVDPRHTGIENIFWTDLNKLIDGEYKFYINNYNRRHNHGARAEIVFKDKVYTYLIDERIEKDVVIATVTLKNGELQSITQSKWETGSSSNNIYGLDSNNYHKVNLISWSPNYWVDSKGNDKGAKFACFFLEGCKSPDDIRTIHNENLTPELRNHRKVFETLGNQIKCESVDNQLSGIAFNTDGITDERVIIKVDNKQTFEIKF